MQIQELVYAGLDAMRSAVPLELCAYLHTAEGQGPQLFLGAPALSEVDPTQAFTLFSALRDTLEARPSEGAIPLGGYNAVPFYSSGPRSRGLHVAGRRTSPLEDPERAVVGRLARAVAGIAHALEAPERAPRPPHPSAPVRVAVEVVGGRARAEVAAPFGDEVRTGLGEESSPQRAVAAAVIDAVDASLKLVEANQGEFGGESAVLVLIADQLGRVQIGAALVGETADALQATALAAIEAATRLG